MENNSELWHRVCFIYITYNLYIPLIIINYSGSYSCKFWIIECSVHLKCVQVSAHLIFLKRFKILGISTKLTILCCFSLTTDPATWKNSRHLSKGFLYPFVFGPSFSSMPACVLMYSYRLCALFLFHFYLPVHIDWLQVVLVPSWHCIRMQAFFGGECNLFYFYF